MKTIKFNTNRHYTAAGQRIVATRHDDGVVTFHDLDRMITGEVAGVVAIELFNQRTVMTAYDGGNYSNSSRAWKDGMQRGAVNSQWE